jgi:hypothetical protein
VGKLVSNKMKPASNRTAGDRNFSVKRQVPFYTGILEIRYSFFPNITCFMTDVIRHNLMSLLKRNNQPLTYLLHGAESFLRS